MATPQFIMIGGFLGAGKTTTVSRLARHYVAQGKRVGIVTNDQATDLVDTHSLRSQGFDVGEVPGACFCCNFNQLTSTVEAIEESARPDVFLAEPVGSCTDLVATVIRPLVQIYEKPLDVAPYGVILKPSHGLRILKNDKTAGFSPKAAYIFRKQIEEADFVILNRIDEMTPAQVDELAGLVGTQFPNRPVLRLSARTGEGFAALCEFLEQRGSFGQRALELDYDLYAEGEAELGWLNAQLNIESRHAFSLDDLLLALVETLRAALAAAKSEPAHLKVIGLWEGFYGVANLVSSFTGPELSLPSHCRANQADVIVNARVATDPRALESIVRRAAESVCRDRGARVEFVTMQSFRPGRPVPTHRLPMTP
jgi:Ni2+-binding GTPase involved in maturation of urease and hydrogenase